VAPLRPAPKVRASSELLAPSPRTPSHNRLVQFPALPHVQRQANLWNDEEGYVESEQYQRLLRTRQGALKNSQPWEHLRSRLTEALPDCRVEDWSVLFSDDNYWRVRVYLPEVPQLENGGQEFRAVVVLVSILVPVYVRYSSFHQLFGRKWKKPTLFYEDIPET
jgi:hypothetical protein